MSHPTQVYVRVDGRGLDRALKVLRDRVGPVLGEYRRHLAFRPKVQRDKRRPRRRHAAA